MAPLSSMGSFDGLNSNRRLHNVEEAEKKINIICIFTSYNPDLFIEEFKYRKNPTTVFPRIVSAKVILSSDT